MRKHTWFLWLPTLPYIGFTALLLSNNLDRPVGFLFLVNCFVLTLGTTLSHTVRTVRPAHVSGVAFLVQVAISSLMISFGMGSLGIILPVNGGICIVFLVLTILYSSVVRNIVARIWESIAYITANPSDIKVEGGRFIGGLIGMAGVVLIIIGCFAPFAKLNYFYGREVNLLQMSLHIPKWINNGEMQLTQPHFLLPLVLAIVAEIAILLGRHRILGIVLISFLILCLCVVNSDSIVKMWITGEKTQVELSSGFRFAPTESPFRIFEVRPSVQLLKGPIFISLGFLGLLISYVITLCRDTISARRKTRMQEAENVGS